MDKETKTVGAAAKLKASSVDAPVKKSRRRKAEVVPMQAEEVARPIEDVDIPSVGEDVDIPETGPIDTTTPIDGYITNEEHLAIINDLINKYDSIAASLKEDLNEANNSLNTMNHNYKELYDNFNQSMEVISFFTKLKFWDRLKYAFCPSKYIK